MRTIPLRSAPAAIALAAALAAAAPADTPVPQEHRSVLDLAGTWEARPAAYPAVWPPPADGWKPHAAPHAQTALIGSDDIGPYLPQTSKVVDAGGLPAKPATAAAWFRRRFAIDAAPAGRRALLVCDGIAWRSDLFLNGAPVGSSVLGLAPNVYDVTAALRAGDNELVVAVSGRAALWDRDRGTFVAPIAGIMPGIYDGIRIEFVPATRIDDVFVRTSVARRRLEIDVEMVNDGPKPRTVAAHATVADPRGVARLALDGEPVEIPAGGRAKTTLGADWLPAHLWSPGTPNLHRARVELRARGVTADVREQDFGFREFSAAKTDFLLNGRRQVLLRNSWLRHGGGPRDEILGFVRDETAQFNCIRLHLGFNNPHAIDQADRSGLMVIPEFWGWYSNDDSRFPIDRADVWLPNAAETMRRLVRRFRNHPSIVMWSLANEIMWDSALPPRMAVCDRLVKTVRAEDPTRLLQGDAEITWSNRLDAIGIHYPEGDAGTVGRRYPNGGWIVPNDLDWLTREGTNRSWRAEFVWDRPLTIGEFYARDGDEPERYTPYAGDEAYDRTRWMWQDFGGRDAPMPPGGPWIDMVRMSCDHYRAAGVACLNPWTGTGAQLMPAFLVAPLDHHPNAFGGEPCPRRFVAVNDHHSEFNDIHLQAGLLVDGREVWSERRIPAHVRPGESRQLTVTIRPPAVRQQRRGRLIVRLCWMRGPSPMELHRHEEDFWILPRPTLAGVDASAVALADRPGGPTARALAAMGLAVTPGPGDDAALSGRRLLVIGEGAAGAADLAAAARFAAGGGRVLVLHQTAMPPFVPFQPEIDGRHAASFSWRQAPHPALAGLEDGQLRFWRPDHLVSAETYVRPSVGPAASAAACGGRNGMHWSPLVELRHGRGSLTFCQYPLAARAGIEPAAGTILAQAVRAALASKPADEPPPLRLAPGVGRAARDALDAALVRTADGLQGDGPALVDARTPPDAAARAGLRARVEAGGLLWLRGLDSNTVRGVASLLPWIPGFAPLATNVYGAVRRGEPSFLAGVGSGDLYWARGDNGGRPTAPLGGPVVIPPALDAAWMLTEPALLVAAPLGRGWVLIDQFAWDGALAAETERCTRLVSALARNLGAGFRTPAGAARRYRFAGLDLAPAANRGYLDETADDGRGGWTDGGEDDMRFFLANHSGVVNGMAVAGAAFPTGVVFHGVSYRLADPRANGGRAVVVLRGAGADTNCPASVRAACGGIRADRIWFLHAAAGTAGRASGTTIARYELVYADGSRAAAPVRLGVEVGDWREPKPLSGAQVAWTGRNPKIAPVGIYSMAWDNPHPDRPIAGLQVAGGLDAAQLVLLAVTFGAESGANGRTVAAWDCGRFADGRVAPSVGTNDLAGEGVAAALGERVALRLAGGQHLSGRLDAGPLSAGRPVAIEMEVAPDGPPGGYCGGLFEAGGYQSAGLRMVLGSDLRVTVEHWAGAGPGAAVYLKSRGPLPVGRWTVVRYEHDGREARLLIDGQVQDIKPCPPAAPYAGGVRIGLAGGKDYFFNGVVGSVRVMSLDPAPAK